MKKYYLLLIVHCFFLSSCEKINDLTPNQVTPTKNGIFVQQGTKLISKDLNGLAPYFGNKVAISADGKTAIIGSPGDENGKGAAYIFIKSGNQWVQQGNKLAGSDAIIPAGYYGAVPGYSVALSADGNTAVIGASNDNNFNGAIWVFTRKGNTWTQQGPKLVGSGAIRSGGIAGPAQQGVSVAISGDGNTIIEGGPFDDNYTGAVWIFVRQGDRWVQQGEKLVGIVKNGYHEYGDQGMSVTLSSDGNTAVVGGDLGDGATAIFERTGNEWSQQGDVLIGTGAITDKYYGGVHQGSSVSISANGKVLLIGGSGDNLGVGAVWFFVKTGNTWVQQGTKLVGSNTLPSTYVGGANQGIAVSLSADGNTALVGGSYDNNEIGACWTYIRSGNSWIQLGNKLVANDGLPIVDQSAGLLQGTSVAISADGNTAIVGGHYDNKYTGAAWFYSRQ